MLLYACRGLLHCTCLCMNWVAAPEISKWQAWLLIRSHTISIVACTQRVSPFVRSPGAGIAARVPYTHCHAIGCQEQVSQQHELIAAVTRIRTELSGEDFREFMRKGATQRSTVHAYLDLFCYQQPAYRCWPPLLSSCMAPLPACCRIAVFSAVQRRSLVQALERHRTVGTLPAIMHLLSPLLFSGLAHPRCVYGCKGGSNSVNAFGLGIDVFRPLL